MARRVRDHVDPLMLPPPAVLARQIVADLAKAQREFAAVARALERSPEQPPPVDGEQLAFDE